MTMSIVLAAALMAGGEFTVAERGQKADVAVVLPAHPSESQRYAAEELVKYVAQLTGVKLGVGLQGQPRAIELRSSDAFGKDGYSLWVEGSRLVIAGSARRGCLYGAYDLLERFGCTFCSSRYDHVPYAERLAVPANLQVVERPAFALREALSYDIAHSPELAAKLRKNRSIWTDLPEKFGGNELRPSRELRGHTFDKLVPVKRHFKDHPEYFSEIDGRRKDGRTQLCLANPDVRELARRKVFDTIRAEPEAELFAISQNDWYYQCQCAKCRVLDEAAGSSAGAFIDFVNFIARETAREFPGKWIKSSAYQWTRPPPKNVRLEPNVLFGVAPIECDFSVPINESDYPTNAMEYAELRQWAKAAKHLSYTDYTCNFSHYPLFWPNLEATAGNMKLLRSLGAMSVYGLGAHDTDCGFMQELRAWIFQKLAWNPDAPLWPSVERFCRAFYGPAADEVLAYLEDLESLPRDRVKDPMLIYYRQNSPTFTEDFLRRSLRRWDAAEAAVKGDARRLDNVQRGKFSVVYAILCRKSLIPVTRNPAKFEEYRRLVAWAVDFVARSRGPMRLRENGPLLTTMAYFNVWRNLAALKPEDYACMKLDATFFKFYRPGEWADIVKDAAAEDGQAIKIFNTSYQWALQSETETVGFEPGERFRVRVRVRVDKKPGAKPEAVAFTCGVGNKSDGRDPSKMQRSFRVKELGDGYQWCDFGEFAKRPGQYLWMAMGHFDAGQGAEHPDVAAVYVDSVEIASAGN